MADITISDLELAPALADDMVFPVENLTDTYAATLAMLRRLLNKTFVEEEDADFNDLTDDGFYQCTGTPTNSPVAGTINWTLQVSTQAGVTVQRAFSLDDDFANLYIRRWNGVTWTAWLEVGGGALANKANIEADNFTIAGKTALINMTCPDYNSIVDYTSAWGGLITTNKHGWVYVRGNSDASHPSVNFGISGVIFNVSNEGDNLNGSGSGCLFMIPPAQWGVSGGNGVLRQLYFIPCRGD